MSTNVVRRERKERKRVIFEVTPMLQEDLNGWVSQMMDQISDSHANEVLFMIRNPAVKLRPSAPMITGRMIRRALEANLNPETEFPWDMSYSSRGDIRLTASK